MNFPSPHACCIPAYIIHFDFIILVIFGEEYKYEAPHYAKCITYAAYICLGTFWFDNVETKVRNILLHRSVLFRHCVTRCM